MYGGEAKYHKNPWFKIMQRKKDNPISLARPVRRVLLIWHIQIEDYLRSIFVSPRFQKRLPPKQSEITEPQQIAGPLPCPSPPFSWEQMHEWSQPGGLRVLQLRIHDGYYNCKKGNKADTKADGLQVPVHTLYTTALSSRVSLKWQAGEKWNIKTID